MSSPGAVLRAIRPFLWHHVLPASYQSLQTFSLGFAISVVAGIPIGLAMARIRFVRIALEPYVMTLNSMPMLALFPVMIILFGIDTKLRVAATVLFGIFPVIVNTMTGALRVDVEFEDVGRSFVASGWRRLTTIIFPGSLDYIFAGIRVGFGHAMIGAIVIELEASLVGMGSIMNQYTQNLQLGPFFLCVMVLGTFSIGFSLFHRWLQRWVTQPWTRRRHPRYRAMPAAHSHENFLYVLLRGISRRGRPLRPFASAAYRVFTYIARILTSRVGAWFLRLLTLGTFIEMWTYETHRVSQAVLPTPWTFARAFWQLSIVHPTVYSPLLQTLEVFATGWILALVIGIPIGLVMGRSRRVELALDPYISFLYALPIIVYVPIFVIWLGFGFNFGVAFVVVSAMFAVVINTMQGVHSVDPNLIDVGRSFCASERQITRRIVLPSTRPFIVAGARLAFAISWIAVIVSEVVSSETGLGGMISTYNTNFQIADMLVPIAFIAIISVVLLTVANKLMPRLTPWAPNF
jgi:NitT/TauT family transport system permease protein